MSRAVNGNYGTFDSIGIKFAVKKWCGAKRIDQKYFFKDVLKLHSSTWWFSICKKGYADEVELRIVCKAVGYDFKKLNFVEGATNEEIEKDKEKARERQRKNRPHHEEYQQLSFEPEQPIKRTENDISDILAKIEDHDLIQILGSKRVREIYLLAFYEKEKGLLN